LRGRGEWRHRVEGMHLTGAKTWSMVVSAPTELVFGMGAVKGSLQGSLDHKDGNREGEGGGTTHVSL
jgi:hypothetical protein